MIYEGMGRTGDYIKQRAVTSDRYRGSAPDVLRNSSCRSRLDGILVMYLMITHTRNEEGMSSLSFHGHVMAL